MPNRDDYDSSEYVYDEESDTLIPLSDDCDWYRGDGERIESD